MGVRITDLSPFLSNIMLNELDRELEKCVRCQTRHVLDNGLDTKKDGTATRFYGIA